MLFGVQLLCVYLHAHIYTFYSYTLYYTLWLLNIAMGNGP